MNFDELMAPFSLAEFCYSETAERLGIHSILNPQKCSDHAVICENILSLVQYVLRPVCHQFSVRPQITSGFRCEKLNRYVGGVPTSQHMTGQAVDFVTPDIDLLSVAQWMSANLSYDQLLIERAKGEVWIHTSYVTEEENRKEVKWFDGEKWHKGLPEREDLYSF